MSTNKQSTIKTRVESNEEYHSTDAISSSGLKSIWKNSYSVKQFLNAKYKPSKAFEIGTAIHTLCLEGREKYDQENYVITEKIDRRTKAGKAAMEHHNEMGKGKTIIDVDDHYMIEELFKNFNRNKKAVKYCQGTVELSHYTELNGVDVKVRPDCINVEKGFISDIKTTQSANPIDFKREIFKYGYHLQAAFYSDALGLPVENFRFIAMQKTYPFTVEVYALSDDTIEKGRDAYEKALIHWKAYLETGIPTDYIWNDYDDNATIKL